MAEGAFDGSVKCPVCARDFEPGKINGHLDECLRSSTADDSQLRPPSKRARIKQPPAPALFFPVFQGTSSNAQRNLSAPTATPEEDPQPTRPAPLTLSVCTANIISSLHPQPSRAGNASSVTETAFCDKGCAAISSQLRLKKPLAEIMRPNTLEEYFGQNKLIGEQTLLRTLLQSEGIPSLILWGPPGCGKVLFQSTNTFYYIIQCELLPSFILLFLLCSTAISNLRWTCRRINDEIAVDNTTLAHIIASLIKQKAMGRFVTLSATSASTAEVREVIKQAQNEIRLFKRRTVLFIDEIHRFNKLQQDTFLPHVECGTITLIGATTENPSFQINSALLSRCRVLVLERLSLEALGSILRRAVDFLDLRLLKQDEEEPKTLSEPQVCVEQAALDTLAHLCDGDARAALNGLQMALQACSLQNTDRIILMEKHVKEVLQRSHFLYDRAGTKLVKSLFLVSTLLALTWLHLAPAEICGINVPAQPAPHGNAESLVKRMPEQSPSQAQILCVMKLFHWPTELDGVDCTNSPRAFTSQVPSEHCLKTNLSEEKQFCSVMQTAVIFGGRAGSYDTNGCEEHYNSISALHKSMRGSDANAGLYWLGRMLEGGEEPLYVARRLVRFASEDVG
ncbi:hypothetical protein DNTS_035392 [Danionella cerebrum]|uniref:UBZ4-type domain-containing protein n=1 Tax=Danionella cerebrum TaxID=2873325 RepID=A0A553PEJ0_9TELE|nr:hypothetical protein DNTS_035392 [Danionella translucida]